MTQPIKEQIQWFWEQCGWKYKQGKFVEEGNSEMSVWLPPIADGVIHLASPDIDLNNLFEYAVPLITPKTLMVESYIDDGIMKFSVAILSEKQSGGLWGGNDKDPALALFWAIYKAFGGKE